MNAINFGGVAPPAGNSSEVPSLFECLMDRDQTEMPEYYLPEAQGVVIAGEAMLRAAGYRPGSYRPRLFGKPVWYQEKRHVFRRLTYDEGRVLQVKDAEIFGSSSASIRATRVLMASATHTIFPLWSVPLVGGRFGRASVRRRCDWLIIAIRPRSLRWQGSGRRHGIEVTGPEQNRYRAPNDNKVKI
jgi:hypothetical protein